MCLKIVLKVFENEVPPGSFSSLPASGAFVIYPFFSAARTSSLILRPEKNSPGVDSVVVVLHLINLGVGPGLGSDVGVSSVLGSPSVAFVLF